MQIRMNNPDLRPDTVAASIQDIPTCLSESQVLSVDANRVYLVAYLCSLADRLKS